MWLMEWMPAFGGVVVVVLLLLRTSRSAALVTASLLLGVLWLGGAMMALRVKINFANFIAYPITFGIGVDYAVNVAQRYYADANRNVVSALRTTGGAVVLCSLTTILGYLALLGSHNQAIRSLGTIGVVGEVCCLLAAVLVLPALWLTVQSRQTRAPAAPPGALGAGVAP